MSSKFMALVRCKDHKPKPVKLEYVKTVEPLGYPETAAVCGITDCEVAGLLWLTTEEKNAYEHGERIFKIPNNATKVKVK